MVGLRRGGGQPPHRRTRQAGRQATLQGSTLQGRPGAPPAPNSGAGQAGSGRHGEGGEGRGRQRAAQAHPSSGRRCSSPPACGRPAPSWPCLHIGGRQQQRQGGWGAPAAAAGARGAGVRLRHEGGQVVPVQPPLRRTRQEGRPGRRRAHACTAAAPQLTASLPLDDGDRLLRVHACRLQPLRLCPHLQRRLVRQHANCARDAGGGGEGGGRRWCLPRYGAAGPADTWHQQCSSPPKAHLFLQHSGAVLKWQKPRSECQQVLAGSLHGGSRLLFNDVAKTKSHIHQLGQAWNGSSSCTPRGQPWGRSGGRKAEAAGAPSAGAIRAGRL